MSRNGTPEQVLTGGALRATIGSTQLHHKLWTRQCSKGLSMGLGGGDPRGKPLVAHSSSAHASGSHGGLQWPLQQACPWPSRCMGEGFCRVNLARRQVVDGVSMKLSREFFE